MRFARRVVLDAELASFSFIDPPLTSSSSPISGAGELPVAIQLVAKLFQEPTLFSVADAFEKATPFRNQRPAFVGCR